MTASDREQESYTEELLEQLLVAQRRTANYVAIQTWLTVLLLTLGIAAGAIGIALANR